MNDPHQGSYCSLFSIERCPSSIAANVAQRKGHLVVISAQLQTLGPTEGGYGLPKKIGLQQTVSGLIIGRF